MKRLLFIRYFSYNNIKGGRTMDVGKMILEIRKSNDLSQEQFGNLFHVTRQTVSN